LGGCPSRIRTSVHGSKVRCPTTRRRGSSGSFLESIPGTPRARKWSGRRDSNPRPSPWQGDALPTEPLPLEGPTTSRRWCREPESNWRHRDFQSRALPTELSRPDGQPGFGHPSANRRISRAPIGLQRRRRCRGALPGQNCTRRTLAWVERPAGGKRPPGHARIAPSKARAGPNRPLDRRKRSGGATLSRCGPGHAPRASRRATPPSAASAARPSAPQLSPRSARPGAGPVSPAAWR
jgi:hypothetical protein